jgi:L-threonylcarbamoyladenylate synthase
MHRITTDQESCVQETAAVLRRGGVTVLPTDTIYGFSTPISSESGYRRILAIKASDGSRHGFVHLADSVAMVERYVASWGCTSSEAMTTIWPAPLTAVLNAGGECPGWIGSTIAFRVPQHEVLRAIIEALGEPVVSTSVNRAGRPPFVDIDVIQGEFDDEVDLIVAEPKPLVGRPSTLVDFCGKLPVVRRRGAYAFATDGNPSN